VEEGSTIAIFGLGAVGLAVSFFFPILVLNFSSINETKTTLTIKFPFLLSYLYIK
jgi:hypothetical protein